MPIVFFFFTTTHILFVRIKILYKFICIRYLFYICALLFGISDK